MPPKKELSETVAELRAHIDAAQSELDLAAAFQEVWKPTVHDTDLHARMGLSFASQGLGVIRIALRREMLMALMRLWDTTSKGNPVQLHEACAQLRSDELLDFLAYERAARVCATSGNDELIVLRHQIKLELVQQVEKAEVIVGKYFNGTKPTRRFLELLSLRNDRLAHRTIAMKKTDGPSVKDNEIEEFYSDTCELMVCLMHIVKAIAYSPTDTANVYGFYAAEFWKRVSSQPPAPDLRPAT